MDDKSTLRLHGFRCSILYTLYSEKLCSKLSYGLENDSKNGWIRHTTHNWSLLSERLYGSVTSSKESKANPLEIAAK